MGYWVGVEIDTGGPEPAALTDHLNVTSNLNAMFRLAIHPGQEWTRESRTGLTGLDGLPCTEAAALLAPAVDRMHAEPARYEDLAPENGWGTYTHAVNVLEDLLAQCRNHPLARVYVH